MDKQDDGGSVSPGRTHTRVGDGDVITEQLTGGLSLLDYFAGQVTAGMEANSDEGFGTDKDAAEYAYARANALLAERRKRLEAMADDPEVLDATAETIIKSGDLDLPKTCGGCAKAQYTSDGHVLCSVTHDRVHPGGPPPDWCRHYTAKPEEVETLAERRKRLEAMADDPAIIDKTADAGGLAQYLEDEGWVWKGRVEDAKQAILAFFGKSNAPGKAVLAEACEIISRVLQVSDGPGGLTEATELAYVFLAKHKETE